MKTITTKLITLSVIVLTALFAFSSCTTKKYYNEGPGVGALTYNLHKSDFNWDDQFGRWFVTINDPDLTVAQLKDGEMAGTVIFDDYYCPMPFVESFYVNYNDGSFVQVVQTIGYEATYGQVTFFIQTNQKLITWEDMYDRYKFKLSLF